MDFKQLRSFAAVVRFGSFTLAAEKLKLSQPSISTHLRQLEEELGAQLVLRSTKNIEVTQKGREIYDYAVRILKLRDRISECCAESFGNILHIGASTIPSCYVLPELLSEFRRLHPDILFEIQQTDSQGVYDGLHQNIFDIGFTGKNISDTDFITLPLCKDRMVLITPAAEPYLSLSRLEPPMIPDLQKETFISREEGSGSLEAAGRLLRLFHLSEEDLHICARVNDSETIKHMVACGLGVSLVSERAAEDFLSAGRILKFDLPAEFSTRSLYVTYRKNSFLSAEATEFLSYLQKKASL